MYTLYIGVWGPNEMETGISIRGISQVQTPLSVSPALVTESGLLRIKLHYSGGAIGDLLVTLGDGIATIQVQTMVTAVFGAETPS